MLRKFTLAKIPSVLLGPGSDVEMTTRKFQAPIWFSDIGAELFQEISYLGDCIKEIMRTKLTHASSPPTGPRIRTGPDPPNRTV